MDHTNINKNFEIKFTQLFIDNAYIESVKKTSISVIDPATEEELCKISEATSTDVDLAVQAAKKGVEAWSSTSLDERVRLLNELARNVENNIEEYSYLESKDNGKPFNDSIEDIKEVVRVIRYYAGFCDKAFGHTYTTYDDLTISTRRVPYGIVGCIVPWNYPLLMAAWKIFPAIAAGNAVVLKPSEETPLTALRLGQSIVEAGLPAGLVNIVPGYGSETGNAISSHSEINKVSFTGSTGVGRQILKSSSESNLKKVHLELGGKSPIVVFADADIDKAVFWTVDGAFRNSSQNCCCSSRIYVEESIYDSFVEKLVEETKKIKIVSSYTYSNDTSLAIGPLINSRQYKNCLQYIQIGKETENLNIVCGGGRPNEFAKGYFIEPTIFTNVPDDSKLAREEIFAPVLCVMKPFKNVKEALHRANDTIYGLAAGVFTSNMNVAEYFVRNLQAGTVWVNFYNITAYNVPFGGMKQSGFGRDNGEAAVEEYSTTKAVYQKFDLNI